MGTSMKANTRPAARLGLAWRRAVLALLTILLLANGGPASAGSAHAAFDWTGTYAGVFAGHGRTDNRIVDADGFANWGNPGSVVDYDGAGVLGGALIGKKFAIGGVPLRIELDGTFGYLPAKRDALDPEGRDETAKSEFRWIATARAGIEQAIGRATLFATGGLALAEIANSVTDIDSGPTRGPLTIPFETARRKSAGWPESVKAPLSTTLNLDFGRKRGWTSTIPFATARRKSAGWPESVSRHPWPTPGHCASRARIWISGGKPIT